MNNATRKALAVFGLTVMGFALGCGIVHGLLGNYALAAGFFSSLIIAGIGTWLIAVDVQQHFMEEIVDDMKSTGALDIVLKNAKYMEQRPRHATPVVRSPGQVFEPATKIED